MEFYIKKIKKNEECYYKFFENKYRVIHRVEDGKHASTIETVEIKSDSIENFEGFNQTSTKEEFEKHFINAMIENGVFDFYSMVGLAVKKSAQEYIITKNN